MKALLAILAFAICSQAQQPQPKPDQRLLEIQSEIRVIQIQIDALNRRQGELEGERLQIVQAFGAATAPAATTENDAATEIGPINDSPKTTSGTEVRVKGYYRKDGTYVHPHTRSAPRRHAHAQAAEQIDWRLIKEMSGDIPDHPGLTIETYGAEVARGDDKVKLKVRMAFPNGSPGDLLRKHVPTGIDPSSIDRVEGGIELDCKSLTVKPMKGQADVYQFNGNHFKSKEPPFKIADSHVFAQYFCEQPSTPTGTPTLKPSPSKQTAPSAPSLP